MTEAVAGRRIALRILGASLFLGWSGTARAATFHVATDGDDANSCSAAENPATPKQTVYDGMRCLYAGDTLLIAPGTYHPQAPNDGGSDNISDHFYGTDDNHRITIKAQTPGTVIFTPAPTTRMAHVFDYYDPNPSNPEIGSYVTYDGFVFDMFSGDRDADCPGPAGGGGLICTHAYASAFRFEGYTGSHSIIQNCEIKNFVTIAFAGIGQYSQFLNNFVHDYVPYTVKNQQICTQDMGYNCWSVGGYDYSSYATYRGNRFENCGLEGFQYWDASGDAVQGKVFDRNLWLGNGYQINTDGSSRLGSALVNGTNGGGVSPIVITNNVFVKNNHVLGYPSQKTIFANNTVVNNQHGIESESIGAEGQVVNNVFWGNGDDINGTVTPAVFANNICGGGQCPAGNSNGTDPLFVDAAATDFHLQAVSPAIDQGQAAADVVTDFDGVTRPQGGAFDIGAFEYCESGCAPATGGTAGSSGGAGGVTLGAGGTAPSGGIGGKSVGGTGGGNATHASKTKDDESGCGCRTVRRSDSPAGLLVGLLLLFLGRLHRRPDSSRRVLV